jgi:hypothetical protein
LRFGHVGAVSAIICGHNLCRHIENTGQMRVIADLYCSATTTLSGSDNHLVRWI